MGACLSCSSSEFCAPGSYECSPGTMETSAAGDGGTDAVAGDGGAAGSPSEVNGGFGGGSPDAGGWGGIGGSADAGASGAAGSDNPPSNACNPAIPADGCTLSDDTGIYVDPTSGDDRALGTRDAPLASAERALLIASDLGKPVYLCNAEFDEHLDATDSAVALRGGYTCPGDERGAWTYAAEERATVRATTPGVVLDVRDVSGFSVSDVDFHAADGVDAGESSVAAFVAASTGVTFTRVALRAGKGTDGGDAELEPFTLPSPASLDGKTPDQQPQVPKECECPAGDTTRGGGAGVVGGPGGSGAPDWGGGKGGQVGDCTVANGGRGADAPGNPPGEPASVLGQLLLDGWHPARGADGEDGAAGQGGGGAGARTSSASAFSGGGCGGCGGRGGPGGGGGGGSIALLALEAGVLLERVTLEATDAGHGGDGVAGQAGQAGGAPGATIVNNCIGGNGGRGADGAAGGGGAGGVSIALLSLRSGINWDAFTELSAATAGNGGVGGLPSVNGGINGLSRTTLVLDPG